MHAEAIEWLFRTSDDVQAHDYLTRQVARYDSLSLEQQAAEEAEWQAESDRIHTEWLASGEPDWWEELKKKRAVAMAERAALDAAHRAIMMGDDDAAADAEEERYEKTLEDWRRKYDHLWPPLKTLEQLEKERDAAQNEWDAFGGACTQQQLDAWKTKHRDVSLPFTKELKPVNVIPFPKSEKLEKPRYVFESIADLRSMPPQTWLVDRWIPERSVGIIYGKWASGKSFIGFDLLLHLAYGMGEWHGVRLPGVPCEVLLIAREGGNGFRSRVDSFKKHHDLTNDTDRIVFMRSPVNFGDTAQFEGLKTAIESTRKKFRVVMVDTVGRALPGEDMFEPKSITRFMEHLQQLGEISEGVAVGIHHENKTGGVMGSAYFENNADFMFHVEREGNPERNPLRAGTIACVKQKDGADGWSKSVAYKVVEDSLVLERLAEPAQAPRGEKLSDRQALGLKALQEAIYIKGELVNGVQAVTEDAWREEMFQRDILKKDDANPRAAFRQIRDALARKGKIVSRNGYVHPRGVTPLVPLPGSTK